MTQAGLRSSTEAATTRSGGAVTVVVLEGDLDLASLDEFSRAVETADPDGNLVLDLSAVRFIDSSGIHGVVRARGARAEHGCDLVLVVEPGSAVERVFDMSGLSDVLSPKPDRDTALGALEAAHPAGDGARR